MAGSRGPLCLDPRHRIGRATLDRPRLCPRSRRLARSARTQATRPSASPSGRRVRLAAVDDAGITPALVAHLVADQFPQWAHLGVSPIELDGWDNTTFRLGHELCVRLPSDEGYVPQVDKEHRWLPILAPQLPLPIPEPVAKGRPGCGYQWPWSIYRWIEGEPATIDRVDDMTRFAHDLAVFLSALYAIDPTRWTTTRPVQLLPWRLVGRLRQGDTRVDRAARRRGRRRDGERRLGLSTERRMGSSTGVGAWGRGGLEPPRGWRAPRRRHRFRLLCRR